jgi:hypothetical protein
MNSDANNYFTEELAERYGLKASDFFKLIHCGLKIRQALTSATIRIRR